MEAAHLDVLREAVEKRQRKETMERALGRTVRGRGLEFSVYVQIMGDIRDFAKSHDLPEIDAARQLLGEGEDKP